MVRVGAGGGWRGRGLGGRGGADTLAPDEESEAVRRFVAPSLVSTRAFANRKNDLHLYNGREDVFASIHDFVKP